MRMRVLKENDTDTSTQHSDRLVPDNDKRRLIRKIIDKIDMISTICSRALGISKNAVAADILQDLNIVRDSRALDVLGNTPWNNATREIVNTLSMHNAVPSLENAYRMLLRLTEDDVIQALRINRLDHNAARELGFDSDDIIDVVDDDYFTEALSGYGVINESTSRMYLKRLIQHCARKRK